MPICKICGKNLKNPNASSHLNSKFHLQKLREHKPKDLDYSKKDISIDKSINKELFDLKKTVLNLEKRILKIENILKLEGPTSDIISRHIINDKSKSIDLEQEIVNIVNQRSNLQQIKGNFALKDLREILLKDYKITEKYFEDCILRLYRKQIVDLQPGGNPADYHLSSPTGKKFYYLIVKG